LTYALNVVWCMKRKGTMKKLCQIEDCEMPHCSKCGCHYDLYAAYGKKVCDDCQIEEAKDESRAVTKAFNGNYEEANNFMGW